jgi:hypothetical protein
MSGGVRFHVECLPFRGDGRVGLTPESTPDAQTGWAAGEICAYTSVLPANTNEEGSTGRGCVEIAHLPDGGVALRDSKDRSKAPHVYDRHEWECFLIGAKNGEFDLPVA